MSSSASDLDRDSPQHDGGQRDRRGDDAVATPGGSRAVAALAPMPGRILIVEDEPDAAELLSNLLRLSGHTVHIATEGVSALELYDRVRPQVVICDLGLPGMTGYEVVTKMLQRAHDPRPTMIALTGLVSARAGLHPHDSGFDHHLVKPADPEALLRLIDASMRTELWVTSGRGMRF